MSLLKQIQDAAVDGSTDLETLLRKCRILAARLKHEAFKNWVQWELDGYAPEVEIPEYRTFSCHCFGHLSGLFGRGLRNAPLAESNIPEEMRETLTKTQLRQGVSSLKDLVDNCEGGSLQCHWPADAVAILANEFYENMTLAQAWMLVPKNEVVGILSTVRNRILSFALEIETSNPEAGEAAPGNIPVPKETVSQIFNTYIYGTVGNVASGTGITQSGTVNIQKGDFYSLADYLKSQGINETDIQKLKAAINVDPPAPDKTFGKKVSAWMGNMIKKSAEGSWKVTTQVASSVLSAAIKHYYGL